MQLSVIVPVYNEERTIRKVLQQLTSKKEIFQIIVVNDGSTDRTASEIQKVKHAKLTVIHQENTGKGSAIRAGLEDVRGDYVLIQDADLEYHPDDITLLCAPIKNRDNVQVVYGSRFLGPHSNLLYWHRLGNSFLNSLLNILYDTTLSDMETCYKLMPTDLLKSLNLKANSFDFEPEVTCKLLKKGVRIYEVPISYVGRDFIEGKKIHWSDGIKALWCIVKCRII